jgi:hypothetical protein
MVSRGNVTSRRTIEALRAGVPNSDAVRQLGCHHSEIEERFGTLLQQTESGYAAGVQPEGILVGGDFGSGKSHLLEYLAHVARERRFVVSKVVVSKETSLADPVRMFRSAVGEAKAPDRLGSGMQNIAESLVFSAPAYAEFFRWTGDRAANLTEHLAASLYLFEYGRDAELRQQIIRFWAGDPLSNTVLKRALREMGQASTYPLGRQPLQRDFAFQRMRFILRMVRAAGYGGMVLLIDEVELIGQYGQKQRARAYQELARWMGLLAASGESFPGLTTVAAITNDFEGAILTSGKCDAEEVPGKLRASGHEADALLAGRAEVGMNLILRRRLPLTRLTTDVVGKAHDDLRTIYSDAFQWDAPPVHERDRRLLSTDVMRPLVRRWITQWDLMRRYPDYRADIEETGLATESYLEEPDLETASDGDEA